MLSSPVSMSASSPFARPGASRVRTPIPSFYDDSDYFPSSTPSPRLLSPSPLPFPTASHPYPHPSIPRRLSGFTDSSPRPQSPRLASLSVSGSGTPSQSGSASASGPSPVRPFPRSPYLASRPLSISRPSSGYGYSHAPSPRMRPSILPSETGTGVSRRPSNRTSSSSLMDDVLTPGDIVGENLDFAGSPLRALPNQVPSPGFAGVAAELEVVRKLGSGSYAVVYLVREVLSRSAGSGSDEDHGAVGRLDLDEVASRKSVSIEYGQEFALKCLSKLNLEDEEALNAQMSEVLIHQSIPTHDNIVTLHRAFETPAYLLLLLEFVPGEDLFYFLEQARDHYDTDACSPSGTSASFMDALQLTRTPPTPSLLSSLAPHQLLSRTRLKLIASMFGQMCDAVAACHDVQVFHRDIKPENFIVMDGFATNTVLDSDGERRERRERKVIVKLSDFGLSTTDTDSSDMDCGSAPYMSYECRNNIAPTYKPRAADVWSLGIVLINMLYHFNPWTDTTEGACSSFSLYRQHPVNFFLHRFAGMTPAVAEFLAARVFNVLPIDPNLDSEDQDDSARIGAREFGMWAKSLPDLLGPPPTMSIGMGGMSTGMGHKRVISTSSTTGHPLALSSGTMSRPTSRHGSHASMAVRRTPVLHARTLSFSRGHGHNHSHSHTTFDFENVLAHARDADVGDLSMILDESPELEEEVMEKVMERPFSPVQEQVGAEKQAEAEEQAEIEAEMEEQEQDNEHDDTESRSESRSQSTTKRRKRGARKGKAATAAASAAAAHAQAQAFVPPVPVMVDQGVSVVDDTLNTLASASQSLARELSRQTSNSMWSMPGTPSTPSLSLHSPRSPPQAISSIPLPIMASMVMTQSHSQFQVRAQQLKQAQHSASHSRSGSVSASTSPVPVVVTPPAPPPTLLKKASKWKLSFGKSSAERVAAAAAATQAATPSPVPSPYLSPSSAAAVSPVSSSYGSVPSFEHQRHQQPVRPQYQHTSQYIGSNTRAANATASNVQNLIMGLSPMPGAGKPSSNGPMFNGDDGHARRVSPLSVQRGRAAAPPTQFQGVLSSLGSANVNTPANNNGYGNGLGYHNPSANNSVANVNAPAPVNNARRNTSPAGVRSGRGGLGSAPSSVYPPVVRSSTNNWRNNTSNGSGTGNGNGTGNGTGNMYGNAHGNVSTVSSAATSTSAFTRYSNGSRQSVSTVATSVSSDSWRNNASGKSNFAPSISSVGSIGSSVSEGSVVSVGSMNSGLSQSKPVNVKILTGIPWELHELPRGQHTRPTGDIFGQPPPQAGAKAKARSRRGKNAVGAELGSIAEACVPSSGLGSTPAQRTDAATSTTDLGSASGDEDKDAHGGPKKVQKGQINALAKMLSALRR